MRPSSRLLRFASARALHVVERQVASVTVAWEIYERTRSPLALGFIGLAQVIPVALLFGVSGDIADRKNRRDVAALSNLLGALSVGGIGVASLLGAPLSVYYLLLFALGACTSLHSPAVAAVLPSLTSESNRARANAMVSAAWDVAAISGPAIGGALLAKTSAVACYGFACMVGIAASVLLWSLPYRSPPASTDRRDWRTGLRFIFRSKTLLPALTLDLFAVLFAGATALLPMFAKDVLHVGPEGLGWLRAAAAVGSVLCAAIVSRLPPFQRPGAVLLRVVAGYALVTIGFGLSRDFSLSLVLLAIGGALDNISVIIRITLEQMLVPESLRGRVSAVKYVFIGFSNELGELESGLAAALLGAPGAVVFGGVTALVVVAAVAAKWPSFRALGPLATLQPEQPEKIG